MWNGAKATSKLNFYPSAKADGKAKADSKRYSSKTQKKKYLRKWLSCPPDEMLITEFHRASLYHPTNA